ncbi:MAG: flagellar motor switch protein FliM [Bryobacteraceae bacterium]
MKRELSQQEIDAYFQAHKDADGIESEGDSAESRPRYAPFDFRRLDRISKSQLSAIHFLHESFVRSLISSLSAYLRSYVSGNLISVEQLPFSDFVDALPSPTCMAYLSMQPHEGQALIEVNPTLLAPILDLILGGNGELAMDVNREITEVEASVLEGLFRIVAQDLEETWKPVVNISFGVTTLETKPQLSKRIAPTEAVVAVAIELRIAESTGTINLAIPSITLKMMGQKLDRQWMAPKSASPAVQSEIKRRLSKMYVDVKCELRGARISLKQIAQLSPGDVIDLSVPLGRRATLTFNGQAAFDASLHVEDDKIMASIESGGIVETVNQNQ